MIDSVEIADAKGTRRLERERFPLALGGVVRLGSPTVDSLCLDPVSMEEDALGLDEVVVVGYGTQRKSDLKALQAQINPHFLYNTLDSIIWMGEMDKSQNS